MDQNTLQGFYDEMEKISEGHAALGAELLGAPGAAIGGYMSGGAKGALGGGGGALAGLGGGMLASKYLGKHISPEFAQKHPIISTALKAIPLAVGSTVGGAVGEHLLRRK